MKTTTDNNFGLIAAACRYNSGKSMCDSGDYYGRHYERPVPADAVRIHVYGNREVTACMSTAHYLADRCTVDTDLTEQFNAWAPEQPGSWFGLGERFCTDVLGLTQHVRGNVCNGEHDLDQVFVYEVYSANTKESGWIYADDALFVAYVHTGCDIRGGYSYPLFMRHNGDYSMPLDFMVVWCVSEARLGGEPLDRCAVDENWQQGYSSNPTHEFNQDIERIFWHGDDWVIVRLKDGTICKVHAQMPYSD